MAEAVILRTKLRGTQCNRHGCTDHSSIEPFIPHQTNENQGG